MIDYTTLVEELRDIFLDYRTTAHFEEVSDGSGKVYFDYELDCTKEQEVEAEWLIVDFIEHKMYELIDKVYAK